MTPRTLGTTGINVPRAILGCGTFGGIGGARHLVGRGLDRKAAFATLDEALALGIDVLDTAERYADGESERTIGEWLRHRPRNVTHAELMTDAVHDALDQLRNAAAARDVSCGGMALAWVIAHPDCTAPIVGPSRSAPHLAHVAEALELTLTVDEHAQFATWFEATAA